MLHYIIQVVAFQLLFLIAYDVFLKKETFFQWNRFYLLVTSVLSFALPFVKLGLIQRSIPQEYMVQLPAVLIGASTKQPLLMQGEEVVLSSAATSSSITFLQILSAVWVIGMIVSIGFFVYKLIQIWRLKQNGTSFKINGLKVVSIKETDVAFSFFGTIYLGETISEVNKKDILLHETVHIKQRHSIDLLFFEILKIVFWFNPLSYIFQKRLELLHEYIADKTVAKQNEDPSYYQTLLSQVFQTENVSFINSFFNKSLIKNRIIMLQKSKSNRLFQLKYLLLVPMVLGMLIYTSCTEEPQTKESSLTEKLEELNVELNTTDISEEEMEMFLEIVKNTLADNKEVKARLFEYGKNQNVEVTETEYHGDEELGVPFAVIDKVPTFPGCSGENTESKKCFNQSLVKFVQENFDTKLAENLGLKGVQKIYVQFKIGKSGAIEEVKARAPHPQLKEEANRVVNALPTMIPGEHKGKPVSVLYSLPIKFKIEE